MNDHGTRWPPASKAQVADLVALRDATARRAAGACLVEGERLLVEALEAGLLPRLVAVAPALASHPAVQRASRAGAAVVQLGQRAAQRASEREHAPGLLAAVPIPPAWEAHVPPAGAALVVVLCGLQDPGNVGTLLRSARAFAAEACVITPGTADPFGPKVVRASAGAALRLPVAGRDLPALPALAAQLGLTPVAAVPPGDFRVPADSDARAAARMPVGAGARGAVGHGGGRLTALPARCLLLLGHETRGVPVFPECAPASVRQEAGVDSLNVAVAGSILMADWYRMQRA